MCVLFTLIAYIDHVHYKCSHHLFIIMPSECLPSNVVKLLKLQSGVGVQSNSVFGGDLQHLNKIMSHASVM